MLTGSDILFRFRAACLLEHKIQIILSNIALEGATGFGLRTLLFELATVTDAHSSNIFIVLTLFILLAHFQGLAGWTGKGVSISIIGKRFFRENTFFRASAFLVCSSDEK